MAINPDFLAPCGLYCGVCAIYIAHSDNNIKLKERQVNLYKGGTPGKGTLPNLEKAPNFESNKWPNFTDSEWYGKIRGFFGGQK
jgi:hypothetical protein